MCHAERLICITTIAQHEGSLDVSQYELVHTIRFESARRLPRVPDGHPCKNLYGLAFYLDIHVVG